MKLSIIVPVYNEERTVGVLLKKLISLSIPEIEKEIIVVDDGSTDSTVTKISSISANLSNVRIVKHLTNQGKGAAIRTGIKNAKGEYIVIQDADLEYDPKDIEQLIAPIQSGEAKVVYGTRLKRLPDLSRDESKPTFLLHYFGNKMLSFITSLLYLQWITDMETCYKLIPRKVFKEIELKATGFEFEPEITAKLLKKGYKIVEVSIKTTPRGYEEGKKLQTFSDGWKAIWALIKYRFID